VEQSESLRVRLGQQGFEVSENLDSIASNRSFDAVLLIEVIEHVPDPASLVKACAALARPGGSVFFSTVNRNWLAGLLVILAAEYLLGIVERGTHRYDQLVKPAELRRWANAAGLRHTDTTGVSYLPLIRRSRLTATTILNYMMQFSNEE